MTKVRVEPSAHDFRIQRTFATHKERHPVQRLSIPIVLAALLITLVPLLPVVIFGLGLLALGMFSTVPAVNLYLGEQATTAKGTAASMYLSLYYFGGSFGAVLPELALVWAGWPGVALLCLGMVLIALTSDALLCR